MNILGFSAFYHDAAACLLQDGIIKNAVQEERFTRIKHDENFPIKSIAFCIEESKLNFDEIDYIVFYEKPFPKFERIFETYLAFAPFGFANFMASFSTWIKDKLFLKKKIIKLFYDNFNVNINNKLLFSEHHLSHAASAFFPSPYEQSAILTMDGVGEWATTSIALGSANNIEIIEEIVFPHSLGLLYSAFTYFTGFKVNSGEYKLMGLAPYGEPKYVDLIKNKLISIKHDGSFQLDMNYFNYCTNLTMTNNNFEKLFERPRRLPEDPITQSDMDIAASIQIITEEIIIKIAQYIKNKTNAKNLCLAGGVALNCVANGKLLETKIFENIWIQPASGDSGGAIGAALAAYYLYCKKSRIVNKNDSMNFTYLGPSYNDKEIQDRLMKIGANFEIFSDEDQLLSITVNALCSEKAVGWHQGRMEFGPRALGNRSILADPRSPKMQTNLNLKVKFRESFRPFAPSILREHITDYYEMDNDSHYMLFVSNLISSKQFKINSMNSGLSKLNEIRSEIPAVTHIDYSSRIQTVSKTSNNKFYQLINYFYKITGCPILVNTSFNIRGEPIVNTPEEAYKCFMGTDIDLLVIGNCLLKKENQNKLLIKQYINNFDLD